MLWVAAILSTLCLPSTDDFARALEPRVLEFPRDHGAHPEFKTEWWYFTGNLTASTGRRFGYQLTFFRSAVTPEQTPRESAWATRDIYLGHFALTDVAKKAFHHDERLSRESLGLAGASVTDLDVWIRDWRARRRSDGSIRLEAAADEMAIALTLRPTKPPALHGEQPGLSLKGSSPGQASYYVTLSRCETEGSIRVGEERFDVSGLSWMDQEFGSSQLDASQVGWDWFSLQLDDGSELMLYLMRRRDGSFDDTSSGTFVSSEGETRHLPKDAFLIRATARWTSPSSGATYPAAWTIEVPSLGYQLEVRPLVANQELETVGTTDVTYWEGTCRASGRRGGEDISGHGYVELVGYAGPFLRDI
ncbi:MAG: lipocalin-like domain-containing protein [Planctomycetota bacterium]